ncbi:RNA polymerase sigma-70 factor [Chitinophaga sp.]|uniref:RNA polymerase sigma-70 factor n=1 Tax=Chitinophaga sp. TaxID=1869181 RepID=UPI002F935829
MKAELKNDEYCFSLLKEGNKESYYYLIRVHAPVLYKYAEGLIFDSAAAEDIVEDVFVRLWQKHTVFDDLDEVKKFLYVAVRNACLNFKRDKERERKKFEIFTSMSAEDIGIDEIIYAELMADVRKAIDGLPPKMREVFILGYINQLSNYEIAAQLGLSYQTVRNQKTKALTIIRGMLKTQPNYKRLY